MEDGRKILTGKQTYRNETSKKLRCRWEDNSRMYLKEIGDNTNNLIDLAQDRVYYRALVNATLNLWFL